ncbi:ABC transporter permease (plasmid) [Bacillus sp. CMF21]|uniref:ABC transporter permease n=1 Tax=Metabacillus dongyingensis TaxID=2874282 RepID=UPI001FB3B388|nr:ABC transporter permease [Metabacillus dongyingensis]UNJ81256.1 Putative glutathione transporter, permease component [Metabacillus dongyingensis]USK31222.1 ABC transporter permease [Bacillus sp. CMF21]
MSIIKLTENKKSSFVLKSSSEYTQASFTLITSLVLSLILLVNSFDFKDFSIKPAVFITFMLYALFTGIQFFISLRIKQDIMEHGQIRTSTRRLGYVQLISILTANIFIVSFAFNLIQKRKTSEYTFAVYMVMVQFFIIAVSALNIFKPYVADLFPIGVLILMIIAIFYIAALVIVAKCAESNTTHQVLWFLTIPLILTSITGNLFALLLGISLIIKLRNQNRLGIGQWSLIWDKITRNITAMLGMFFIIFVFAISICSYLTFDYDLAIENNYEVLLQSPSLVYPLGTDNFGRDLFSRIVFGARISLIVGIISTFIPVVIGGILGALAGYYGRQMDNVLMRLLDVLYAIPGILLAIAIIAAFGANTMNLIIALSVGSIPTYARTMRANVLMVSNLEYVDSARALGSSDLAIIFKHIVPNSLAPMIVKATLTIGGAVIATSSLSYLGLGVEPHIPEWGNILKIGSTYLESHSYLAIFPGLAIIALVLSFNFLGDGLRDALDPKMD